MFQAQPLNILQVCIQPSLLAQQKSHYRLVRSPLCSESPVAPHCPQNLTFLSLGAGCVLKSVGYRSVPGIRLTSHCVTPQTPIFLGTFDYPMGTVSTPASSGCSKGRGKSCKVLLPCLVPRECSVGAGHSFAFVKTIHNIPNTALQKGLFKVAFLVLFMVCVLSSRNCYFQEKI